MRSDKKARTSSQCEVSGEIPESNVEKLVPLSVQEAGRVRARLQRMESYLWMNFVSVILLFAAAVIMAYRLGAQNCQ